MLPIHAVRSEIIETLEQHQVVILLGETGSGKTTKMPQFLYQAGYTQHGMIGITEPRRIAATSVARYVAQEFRTQIGDLVGYHVRFDAQSADGTAIKFMTDGILLQEIQHDPNLSKYSVLMIDEAHERSQATDFLLGLLKDLLKRRPDLRVIVASATIDAERFSEYFNQAPIIRVSGRTHSVDIKYLESDVEPYDDSGFFTMEPIIDVIAERIISIHRTEGPGDILVFMPGNEDIKAVIERVEIHEFSNLVTLPVYGGISAEEQDRIFMSYPDKRKVIVATNIAETSITIDGIVYVVDCGYIKQIHFHPANSLQSLDIVQHSQSGCNQRAGRAGRTGPGICHRMYTEANFNSRRPFTEPEILRASLANVVLTMESIGIANIEGFEFLDAPCPEAFHEAYETLITLGAIASDKTGITELGRQMAQLPLEPRMSRMLLEAKKHNCITEVATVAAFLSVHYVFNRPKGKEGEADQAHKRFQDDQSDALRYLSVWRSYVASGYSTSWCIENFLSIRSLLQIKHIREQLLNLLERSGIHLSTTTDRTLILRSVTAGLIYSLFQHASKHIYKGAFREIREVDFFIHPSSGLFPKRKEDMPLIVAAEVLRTTSSFLRCCTKVEIAWLQELVPHLFSEEIILDGFIEDGSLMTGRKITFFNGKGNKTPVQSGKTIINLHDAQKAQDEQIRQAREKGWRQLTFARSIKVTHGSYLETADRKQRTWARSEAKVGVPYFCEIQTFGIEYATPQFQVFEILPKEEEGILLANKGGSSKRELRVAKT